MRVLRWCIFSLALAAKMDLFEDQVDEFLNRCVDAVLPEGLEEFSFYYAGPSLFRLGDQEVRHSFDGPGRLHRFFAEGGRFCHSARFIESRGNNHIFQKCDLTTAGGFESVKNGAWWAKLPMLGLINANVDNTWVNSVHFPGTDILELMSDTSSVLTADMETLEIKAQVDYKDELVTSVLPISPLSTAHPELHPSGHLYNIFLDGHLTSNEVVLFRRHPSTPTVREEVARVNVGPNMVLQHSWGLSHDFAVLFAHPMFFDVLKAATGVLGAANEQPSRQNVTNVFYVPLDKSTPRKFRAAPFMNVHAINTYQDGSKAIFDFEGRPVTDDHESFYSAFHMDLVKNSKAGAAYYKENFEQRGYGIYRLEMPLDSSGEDVLNIHALYAAPLVFPVIHPAVQTRQHCFIWGADGAQIIGADVRLLKLSLCGLSRREMIWQLPGYQLAAQASFAPRGTKEDEGWLLAPLQAIEGGHGALAIVDAATMQTVSVIDLQKGDVLNWGAHSTFVAGKIKNSPPGAEMRVGKVRAALQSCSAQKEL